MSDQQQQQQNQQQATSPLCANDLAPLGITLYIALKRQYQNDRYSFKIFEFGYWTFIKKHPEYVQNYIDALDNDDYHVGSNIVIDIANKVKNNIKYFTVSVQDSVENTKRKIVEITRNPTFQGREQVVQILRNEFACDEQDLQAIDEYLHNINFYSGSMLSYGATESGKTVLIVHIFSIN